MKASIFHTLLVSATMALGWQSSSAQAGPAPDNSKSNQTDSSNRQVTADSQKENAADRGLVQRIRERLMAEKSLSTYAHNVKIVAANGKVTLNGVVRSDEEKARVAGLAEDVAGPQNVVNDLKVAPPKS